MLTPKLSRALSLSETCLKNVLFGKWGEWVSRREGFGVPFCFGTAQVGLVFRCPNVTNLAARTASSLLT